MQKIKRIAAMVGVILLVGMYIATLVLALVGSPNTQNLLMASIVCTVVIPVLIYAMMLVARVLNHAGADNPQEHSAADAPNTDHPKQAGKCSGSQNKTNQDTQSQHGSKTTSKRQKN